MHEFAHALAADLQGDRMPRAMGRLTLNPARHLDPLGSLMLLLVGFGWAKPVEFRPQALRSRRFGAALVALAGPLMNLLLAFIASLLWVALDTPLSGTNGLFFTYFISLNVFLAVFNLMPLPPLDGSRLLTIFLPPRHQRIIYFLDQYGFLILLGLVFFGSLALILPLRDSVTEFIVRLAGA
ncbi:MAG: site-2 protease family protein [Actinobacteria bacterium]|nr:site-2 protease family protein [Actinomycetota bacterium]